MSVRAVHEDISDMLFDTYAQKDLISVGKFLDALKQCGIRKNDLRIKEIMNNLYKLHKKSKHDGGSPESMKIDKASFKEAIAPNLPLIASAFKNQFIIPDFQDFNKEIEKLYFSIKKNTNGAVATYIPQLAKASPDGWGISVCTVDGQRSSIGDVNTPFTMQSCSKALTYGMALEALGLAEVHKYVGTEPSGRNFNELVLDPQSMYDILDPNDALRLLRDDGERPDVKPHNPMINAGAILICSLLRTLDKPEMTLAEQFDYVMAYFSRIAGREPLSFNNAVYLSEREAADRNYAIGYYMRGFNCFPEKANFLECMDFYFQVCSMEATTESMSVIAATLANGGTCPTTGEQVLHPDAVRNVLSMMHSCGMYDYSGQFAFKVGLPAKSGVSGAMLIVVPQVVGISTYSPPLDIYGNSCRGIQFCEELVKIFNFHKYDNVHNSQQKKDPCRQKFDTISNNVVSLLFTAANGDVNNLKRQYLSGMRMDTADYDGRTALHLAAAEGHMDCVEFLVSKCRVPRDPKDRWGKTPIMEAETFKHSNIVNFLKDTTQSSVREKRSNVDVSIDTDLCKGCSKCDLTCDP